MSYQKVYMNQIYSSSTMSYLTQMWRSQLLCDAVIKTGNVSTKAHRLVLIAACPMLQHLENASLGSHLEVRMASDIKQDSINSFLQYLYEGFMTLTEANCKDIEKMGKLLQVESVVKCCSDFYKCLSDKTGIRHGSGMHVNIQDNVEFRHVRTSGFQKTVQDAGLKRMAEPHSPGGKRQRMHHMASPQRIDDRLSMSQGYKADPFERGRTSAADVVEIMEDSLEVIHKEPAVRDAEGWPKETDLPPIRSSQSISVASSQISTNSDIQIVNVESEQDKRTNVSSDVSSHSSLQQTHDLTICDSPTPTSDRLSYSTQSPSSERQTFDSSSVRRDQTRFSDMSGFGSQPQVHPSSQRTSESFPSSSTPKRSHPPSTVSLASSQIPSTSFTPKMPQLQPKPFAVGSANQANIPQPTSIRPAVPMPGPAVPIPGSLTIAQPAELSPASSSNSQDGRSQTSEKFQTKMSSSSSGSQALEQDVNTSQNIEQLLAGEGAHEQSSKEIASSSDLTPDLKIIKVEESDTGGLDMYVGQDGEEEDTGDIQLEWSRDEASNEGSNLSGDQSASWQGQDGSFQGPPQSSTEQGHSRLSTVSASATSEQKSSIPNIASSYKRVLDSVTQINLPQWESSKSNAVFEPFNISNPSSQTWSVDLSSYAQQKLTPDKYIDTSNPTNTCTICQKRYANLQSFKQHWETYHNPSNAKNRCDVCGKISQSPSHLARHMKRHSSEKFFTCQYCHEGFKHKSNLKSHLMTKCLPKHANANENVRHDPKLSQSDDSIGGGFPEK